MSSSEDESDRELLQGFDQLLLNEIEDILQMRDGDSPTNTMMRLFATIFQDIGSTLRASAVSGESTLRASDASTLAASNGDIRNTPSLSINTGVSYSIPLTGRSQSRRLMDPHRRYSSEEYANALDEFKALCETDQARQSTVSTPLLNIMIDYYYDHDREDWPGQQDIVTQVRNMPCGCIFAFSLGLAPNSAVLSCYQTYPQEEIEDMLFYYLFSEARVPNCEELRAILEYQSVMSRYPTQEELREYVINRLSFFANPEEYYQRDRVHHPVSHPERIPVRVHEGDAVGCGICQEDIVTGQRKIVLNRCHHAFHATASECLETACIYTWFEKESLCPMCKEQVQSSEPSTPS